MNDIKILKMFADEINECNLLDGFLLLRDKSAFFLTISQI